MRFAGSGSGLLICLLAVHFLLFTAASTVCAMTYEYGDNDPCFSITPDGSWQGSPIDLYCNVAEAKVARIDVHYEIVPGSARLLYVTLGNSSDWKFVHVLEDGTVNDGTAKIVTQTYISTFNGKKVYQQWILWLKEIGGIGETGSTLNYWWIKVYYQDDYYEGCAVINFIDFAYLANIWLSEIGDPQWDQSCDVAPTDGNDVGDGIIDELDLAVFAEYWL